MIEALLRGKLSREQENMEDILTSNVFGLLQYVPPEMGLFKFLAKAETIEGERPLAVFSGARVGEFRVISFSLWPKWRGCEPDVVLHVGSDDRSSYLVCIEAKYLSGKSSEADGFEQRMNDQLAREWVHLVDKAEAFHAQPVLVYLTADAGCPKSQIQDSLDEYRKKCPTNSHVPLICWLTWRELPGLFGDHSERPLADIARMADRMGLIFFQGITQVASVIADWIFAEPTASWHFQLVPITFQWRFVP
jgi:hypothetical protein